MYAWLAAALLFSAAAADVRATAFDMARDVRAQGCRGHAGTHAPLRYIGGLSDAALDMSHGLSLQKAISRAGYRDQQSASLHVSGDVPALQQAIANQLCASLLDESFTDLGVAQRGHDTWIIIAVPFTAPSAANALAIDTEVLQRINAARAQPRRCGARQLPAVAPLSANAPLRSAAEAHAHDMLDHNYFAHEGHDGSNPALRASAAGYRYRIIGENLASGPTSAAEAVAGWIASPDHCENLMDARFTESGVAFVASSSGPVRIYWVQEFGAPLKP